MSASQILVVDDERIVAAGIKSELESFGYQVTGIASSAKEAVEKAVQGQPDLVLMDIHLKGETDGIEAAREIHDRCGIPVVYLSAYADAETVARARETAAFGYLLKPYEERELLTTIEMALAMHRAEQRLAETERWLAAILEGIDDAVIATDPENQIRFMNPAANALTGWTKEDAIGSTFETVCHLEEPQGRIVLDELADRAVCESCVVELPATTRLISKHGQETPVEGSLSAIYDAHGKFLGMALTLRSTSARLELERVRRQSEVQLRQSQKMEAVRRLAGGMGHHLNNLMTMILGNTSMALSRRSDEAEIKEALTRVDAAGHRAADLIQRLLLFSGRGHGQSHQVDLNTFLPECLNEITPLVEPGIQVVFSPGSDLWPVTLDEVQLGQALLNLVLNAQEAMPEGGQLTLESKNVTFSEEDLANHPSARSGDFVRVRINDTGHGTTANVHTRSLDPDSNEDMGQGVGLRLAFVVAVVEQHHGWIDSNSDIESGTAVDLYFPRFELEAPVDSTPFKTSKPTGTRPTILLAESDAMVRGYGRMILEEQGYTVHVAEDGVQAIEIFRQAPEKINLVIIDLNIPRLTANTVLERLLELDPSVEVFFSSGYFAEDYSEEGRHLLGVIRKPYSRQVLVKYVQQALARRWEEASQHGRIVKICRPEGPDDPERGYGYISTCDGREVYFDSHSLPNHAFQQLELGSEVCFIEEQGDAGLQATSVRPIKQEHQMD